jgi:hypothetical protein
VVQAYGVWLVGAIMLLFEFIAVLVRIVVSLLAFAVAAAVRLLGGRGTGTDATVDPRSDRTDSED